MSDDSAISDSALLCHERLFDEPPRRSVRQSAAMSDDLAVGDRVTAKYLATSQGVRGPGPCGELTKVWADGSCDIRYDDGNVEEGVKPKSISAVTVKKSEEDRVKAKEISAVSEQENGKLVAQAIAEEEGLTLVKSDCEGGTGFKNVLDTYACARAQGLKLADAAHDKSFMAYCYTFKGQRVCYNKLKGYRHLLVRTEIGRFATAADAALALARHVARFGLLQPNERDMSNAEALQTASREGLDLVPSAAAYSGYLNVGFHATNGGARPFFARPGGGRRNSKYLGNYANAATAALALARHYQQVAISALGPSQREHKGKLPHRVMDHERGPKRKRRRPEGGLSDAGQGMDKLEEASLCFCETDRHLTRSRYSFEGTWVACDECSRWCHGECAGLSKDAAEKLESYVCPLCEAADDKELLGELLGGVQATRVARTEGCTGASKHPQWEFAVETGRPTLSNGDETLPRCSICLDGFSGPSGDPSLPGGWGETPCGHCHHYRCLSRWLASDEYDSVCPQCRHAVSKSKSRMMT